MASDNGVGSKGALNSPLHADGGGLVGPPRDDHDGDHRTVTTTPCEMSRDLSNRQIEAVRARAEWQAPPGPLTFLFCHKLGCGPPGQHEAPVRTCFSYLFQAPPPFFSLRALFIVGSFSWTRWGDTKPEDLKEQVV